MLYGEKSRDELNVYLERELAKLNTRKQKQRFYDGMLTRFNIPTDISEGMATFRKHIAEFTTFEAFCALFVLNKGKLSNYFTEKEINLLSEEKFETETINMPIEIPDLVRITDDQFCGRTSLQWIMKLKRAGLINYDPNEQRALKRIKYGKTEIWRPWVSTKNVREIRESMLSGMYIPDPITLNMPEGSSYHYENGVLTVDSLANGMFNLDDGYHRYLAMSQIYDFDKGFDYPMEIRFVGFDNAKANRFIFQQDQKTPMKKIISDSYDPNSAANRIVQKLNEDPMFNLQGKISRNNAIIDGPTLAKVIAQFYPYNKQTDTNIYVVDTKRELAKKFNAISDADDRYMTQKYSVRDLIIILYVFSTSIEPKDYLDTIYYLGKKTETEDKMFALTQAGKVRRVAINLLDKLIEERG